MTYIVPVNVAGKLSINVKLEVSINVPFPSALSKSASPEYKNYSKAFQSKVRTTLIIDLPTNSSFIQLLLSTGIVTKIPLALLEKLFLLVILRKCKRLQFKV